jgi:GNAT superfamily N-acetyltransferase
MDLRRATPDDAAEILSTLEEGFDGYRAWAPRGWAPPVFTPAILASVRERIGGDEAWYLLARDGAEVAGHAALDVTTREEPAPLAAGEMYLAQMFVRARWHGSGVAAALMGGAIAEAARRGVVTMRLWTPERAARARSFYEREGWRATGRRHERSRSAIGLDTVEYAREMGAAGTAAAAARDAS